MKPDRAGLYRAWDMPEALGYPLTIRRFTTRTQRQPDPNQRQCQPQDQAIQEKVHICRLIDHR